MKESDITICGHGSDKPSTKRMDSYLTLRYNSKAANGKHKGIVKVMRLKALTDDGRKKFHDTYKTILGRNVYSQPYRNYVYTQYKGKYYSDCSSSGCATFKKIGYNVPLLNTAGIYQSSLFEEVKVKIVNGHITNPEILKVGDALLFVGADPSRPLQIGHVEYIYEIKGDSKKSTSTTSKPTSIKVQTTSLYFKKYTGSSSSIIDILRALGSDFSMEYRKKLAKSNGISEYSGTAEQNTKLVKLAKAGKLKKA